MIRAVARRPVTMAPAVVTRQEPIERIERVVVGTGAQLEDDEARRRMRHEHREEPVAGPRPFGDEPPAGSGEVGESALVARPDREPGRLYGKMLRRASRIRPRPPMTGADS